MGILRFILFFILFLIIIRLIRLIARYWSSSRGTIDDLRQSQMKRDRHFNNIEEAEFREIKTDDKTENDKNES